VEMRSVSRMLAENPAGSNWRRICAGGLAGGGWCGVALWLIILSQLRWGFDSYQRTVPPLGVTQYARTVHDLEH
jgi:hypothetical protein